MSKVRVTLELEASFIRRLNAAVELGIRDYVKEGRELTPERLLAWVVLLEAKGTIREQADASIPLMNRSDCPEVIVEERRVYADDGSQASGPILTPEVPHD